VATLPSTNATRLLKQQGVEYSTHLYRWEEGGGTAHSARELGLDEHAVVKTLVMEDDLARPLVVLMHGDAQVSTKALARQLGVKRIAPCAPAVAERHSGYRVGGTSPFGLRSPLPIHLERSVLDLPRLWINGGSRGFLLGMSPQDLVRVLKPNLVDAALEP
jgi:Cys-tRNA(Pro) deacylase